MGPRQKVKVQLVGDEVRVLCLIVFRSQTGVWKRSKAGADFAILILA